MKHKILTTTILLLTVCGNIAAQISDNFTLQPSNVFFQQNGLYKEVSIDGCSFTDEIGNPQLPVKIVSFVLPYESTVTGIDIISVTKQKFIC